MADRAAVIAALRRQVEKRVATIEINLTANLIEATPIDTGYARAHWVPTVGSPDMAGDLGAQAAGLAAAASYTLAQGKAYVANGASYIQRLNAGSSKQAPAAFVEREIARTLAELEDGAP